MSNISRALPTSCDDPANTLSTRHHMTLRMLRNLLTSHSSCRFLSRISKIEISQEAETPRRVELPFQGIAEGLALMRQHGASCCFIDTAPSRTDETAALFRLADLVLVPIRPSPSDLWAASATVELLKRDHVPFLFILNQVKANAGITAQAAAALSHHGPVAQTFIGDRVPYAAGMTDGRTAIELTPKGPAALETAELWKNIQACLHVSMQTTKVKVHA
jgi:chromosome partitioning protein